MLLLWLIPFVIALAIFLFFRNKKLEKLKHLEYYFLKLPEIYVKKRKDKDFIDELFETATLYRKSSIDQIIFIHGTFAGSDPYFLEKTKFPLFKSYKTFFDLTQKDRGNFTKKHVKLIEEFFTQDASLFKWSGRNSHMARFEATIELVDNLLDKKLEGKKHILIFSHSHGGQILALLTKLLNDKEMVSKLIEEEFLPESVTAKLNLIRKLEISMVTMGTPVRYQWALSDNIHLLHIINHRGKYPFGGNLFGILFTSRGDYIQQLATARTDYYSIFDLERVKNQKLSAILNEKYQPFFRRRQRLHNDGVHLLIDYRDVSFFPNFYKTIFGHGIYTRFDLVPYHLELIIRYLEKKR